MRVGIPIVLTQNAANMFYKAALRKGLIPDPVLLYIFPSAYHDWAKRFLEASKCVPEDTYPVVLSLLSHSIELEIKARHLFVRDQRAIKREYGHNMLDAYDVLPREWKILTPDEREVLRLASDLESHPNKYFEYWDLLAFIPAWPEKDRLSAIAEKLVGHGDSIPQLQPTKEEWREGRTFMIMPPTK